MSAQRETILVLIYVTTQLAIITAAAPTLATVCKVTTSHAEVSKMPMHCSTVEPPITDPPRSVHVGRLSAPYSV